MKSRILAAVGAALLAGSIAAFAANTTFFTSIGDLVFPFSPPLRDGTAGAIDNMVIGATTPRAATFTSVTNTGGGALTADSITGTDSSLGIDGQSTAQGGSVIITGGTSSTTGNAGGAARLHGGLPGATGVGGDATVRGAIGGATSGAGGLASVTGGAGTAGNAAGGLARAVGGAGQGSAAGGAALLTGGAGGATGAGGAITITGGAGGATSGVGGAVAVTAGTPIAGAGSNVVVTASAGVGSTNGGGVVNLIPGAAASTGAPGTVQVNGNANLMCGSYYFTGATSAAPTSATNQVFYIANRPMIMTSISQVHSVAAGGTSTLDVTKDTGTTAPAGGSALGTAAFNLNATANTVQNATLNATVATITLAAGDRLAVKFNNAIQASVGVVVTACMSPL